MENLWIGSTDLTEVSTRRSLRRLPHAETRHVPSRATSAPSSRPLAFPRPFSHARGEGVRLCSPDRSRHRGVDARPLSLRLDPLTRRLESLPGFSLSRVVVRTNRSEPPDFYDHEAHELTFSDLRTCVCRVFELSARKKSGSMRFSYPHRLLGAPHKLSTGAACPVLQGKVAFARFWPRIARS